VHLLVNVKLLYQDARCNDKDLLLRFYCVLFNELECDYVRYTASIGRISD